MGADSRYDQAFLMGTKKPQLDRVPYATRPMYRRQVCHLEIPILLRSGFCRYYLHVEAVEFACGDVVNFGRLPNQI